jgi:serine/threonine protein kinase
VAVKRIYCDILTLELVESLLNEAVLMSQLNHPNIVRFIGVCVRPPRCSQRIGGHGDQGRLHSVCLVSEYCPRGNLSQFIHRHLRRGKMLPVRAAVAPLCAGVQNEARACAAFKRLPVRRGSGARYRVPARFQAARDSPRHQKVTHSAALPRSSGARRVSANFVLDRQLRIKLTDFGESRRLHVRAASAHSRLCRWLSPRSSARPPTCPPATRAGPDASR